MQTTAAIWESQPTNYQTNWNKYRAAKSFYNLPRYTQTTQSTNGNEVKKQVFTCKTMHHYIQTHYC